MVHQFHHLMLPNHVFESIIQDFPSLYDPLDCNFFNVPFKRTHRRLLLTKYNNLSSIPISDRKLRHLITNFQARFRRRKSQVTSSGSLPSSSVPVLNPITAPMPEIHDRYNTTPQISLNMELFVLESSARAGTVIPVFQELEPNESKLTDLVEDPCASETPQQAMGRETDVQVEAITIDENTDSEHGLSTHDSDGTASLPEPACGVETELPEAPCDTAGPCQENDATQKRTLDAILACLMRQERQNGPSKSFILTSPEINAFVLQEQEPGPLTDLVEDPCASETPQQAMGRETDVQAETITIDENTDSEHGLSTHDSDGTASLPEPAWGVKTELPEAPCDTAGPCQANDATQKSTLDAILACLVRQERVAERAARAQEAQALALHKIVQLLGETERRQ